MEVSIDKLEVSAYKVPTDRPESDGTLRWDSTTIVVVEASGGGTTGLGYTYADLATAQLIADKLERHVTGTDVIALRSTWETMAREIRNLGRPGVASMAISAVDIALWDLKARLLGLALVDLLGQVRDEVAIYGSGGFTSYSNRELCEQLASWVELGIPRVKMKVGRNPRDDPERVRQAREAIGDDVDLFVDANGAYRQKQALALADVFWGNWGVKWFEEPVSSDDHAGLRLLRDRVPGEMEIAAGEYGYRLPYFHWLLRDECVDVAQADVTRCGGVTGFLEVAALCRAHCVPLSAHTAPNVSAHPCCAAFGLRHLEYFHDHVRIEGMLFDGALEPRGGALVPDRSRPGLGLELKSADAEPYRVLRR